MSNDIVNQIISLACIPEEGVPDNETYLIEPAEERRRLTMQMLKNVKEMTYEDF